MSATPSRTRPRCSASCAGAEQLAASFDSVSGDQWQRPGRRSDGAVFTVDTFSRYLLHDVVHHGWDVTGVEAGDAAE